MNDTAGIPARREAHRQLTRVLRQGQSLAETSTPDLPDRDRALARLITMTVLRRLGQIDGLLAQFVQAGKTPPAVYDLLRLGAAQLVWLRQPAHAVVDTAVRLAEQLGAPRQKGLVNAVLRKCAALAPPHETPADLVTNLPVWLRQSWHAAYGPAALSAIAAQLVQEPPHDISVKDNAATWAEQLEATALPTGSLRRPTGGRIESWPGYQEGSWWVQDAAAALPARLFGDLRGKRLVDLCAAPGGKTAQLIQAGASVVAVERDAKRAEMLRRNLDRLRLEAEIIVADVASWRPTGRIDAVLLDAPCTATGTLRRHPEIGWVKNPADVQKLAQTQEKLLDHVASWLAPGAILVYAVCSLQPEEGEQQITRFLARHADFARVAIQGTEIGLDAAVTPQGDLRTLPPMLAGGIDGFYAARLRRT